MICLLALGAPRNYILEGANYGKCRTCLFLICVEVTLNISNQLIWNYYSESSFYTGIDSIHVQTIQISLSLNSSFRVLTHYEYELLSLLKTWSRAVS